jgi:hypothetical protein
MNFKNQLLQANCSLGRLMKAILAARVRRPSPAPTVTAQRIRTRCLTAISLAALTFPTFVEVPE